MIDIAKTAQGSGRTLLVNARLFCPSSGRDEIGGLRIEDGVIADLGAHVNGEAGRV